MTVTHKTVKAKTVKATVLAFRSDRREMPVKWHQVCLSVSELFIDILLVRIHFIIVMIRWTGLVPWDFENSFSR